MILAFQIRIRTVSPYQTTPQIHAIFENVWNSDEIPLRLAYYILLLARPTIALVEANLYPASCSLDRFCGL